ncbi:hypothetical protein [Dentiradicibacter hellwigii]|uniref:Uncharacterized protein n=1 Tax=Dentiradicibacter hellwigii TaxID=3149053 RepID=A0ABV4UHN2_9RHOO
MSGARRIASNPTLSAMHAGCLSREIAKADSPEALRKAAQNRIPYLIGRDRDRLRDEYAERLRALKTRPGGAV